MSAQRECGPTSAFDFDGIKQLAESRVAEAVAHLSASDFRSSQASLISRLMPKVLVQAPELRVHEAADGAEFILTAEPVFRVELEVPIVDPSGLAPLIHWPDVPDWIEFDWDQDSSLVRVIGYTPDLGIEDAFTELERALRDYACHIERATQQIDRFNVALPYILSTLIEVRLSELWDALWSDKSDPLADCGHVDVLIAERKVVTIYDIDPETGKPRSVHP